MMYQYTHQKKFCITSVPQVPEALHTNEIEIHTNNISALFIAFEYSACLNSASLN